MYDNGLKIALNMLCVENNLWKYLMFALRYFDVSEFLEVVYGHLGEFLQTWGKQCFTQIKRQ